MKVCDRGFRNPSHMTPVERRNFERDRLIFTFKKKNIDKYHWNPNGATSRERLYCHETCSPGLQKPSPKTRDPINVIRRNPRNEILRAEVCLNMVYRGTSPIRKNPPPWDLPRTLGIGLR